MVKNNTMDGIKIGVKAKLLMSFVVVTLTTIVASGIGYYSINQIEHSIDRIIQDSVPNMTKAMSLAQLSSSLETSMSLLSKVNSREDSQHLLEGLQGRISEMKAVAMQMSESSQLLEQISQFEMRMVSLEKLAQRRISNTKDLRDSIKMLTEEEESLNSAISIIIDNENFNFLLAAEDLVDNTSTLLASLMNQSLKDLTLALSIKSQLNHVLVNLSVAGLSKDNNKIQGLSVDTASLMKTIMSKYNAFLTGRETENKFVTQYINHILSITQGEGSLFNLRMDEIKFENATPFQETLESEKIIADSYSRYKEVSLIFDEIVISVQGDMVESASIIEMNTSEKMPKMMVDGIDLLKVLLEIRAANNILYGILSEVSQIDSTVFIGPLAERFEAVESEINASLGLVNSIEEGGASLSEDLIKSMRFGHGEKSIFQLKKAELLDIKNIQAELIKQKEGIAAVLNAVSIEVDKSKLAVVDASENSASIVMQGKTLLVVVVAASTLISSLIVWLLVSKNIVARLLVVVDALKALDEM